MYYEIDSDEVPQTLNISLVDKAICFTMDKLTFNDSIVTIDFSEDFSEGQCGFADYDEDEYVVYLNPVLNFEQLVRTLFHELVHIHQYMVGKLSHVGGQSVWYGQKYDCDYEDLPWEVEAFKLEEKLFEEFCLEN